MATILEFRYLPRSGAASHSRTSSLTGEIVFFPGVRYERHAEPDDAKAKRGKCRRDTLEFES